MSMSLRGWITETDQTTALYGGPSLARENDISALIKAGPEGIDLLPAGARPSRSGKRPRLTGRPAPGR
jgi:hypothetical protein